MIYGKINKKGDASTMMMNMKKNVIPEKAYAVLDEEKKINKTTRGIFVNDIKPEYVESYDKLVDSFKQKGAEDEKK